MKVELNYPKYVVHKQERGGCFVNTDCICIYILFLNLMQNSLVAHVTWPEDFNTILTFFSIPFNNQETQSYSKNFIAF